MKRKFSKETVLNFIYSLGAAIVIWGAWSKLEHVRYANFFLTLGLWTEVGIFLIYAFTPATTKEEVAQTSAGTPVDNTELTSTLKQTNDILSGIFKTK